MATENDTLNDMFVVPFDSLNNDDFLHVNSPVGMNDSLYEIYEKCTTFNFCSFKYSDHDAGDFDNNIDPDNNLYNDIETKCNYYTDNQFDTNMQDIGLLGLSIIHFNARSLNANFVKMYDYLNGLSLNFDIIAISETWIQSDSITEFQINGYELFSVRRKTKGGGGVVLYVKQDIQCQLLTEKSVSIEGILECVTVAIQVNKPISKKCVISCIYRTPGSNIDMFIDTINSIFSDSKYISSLFVCGDFNIDLLKNGEHVGTTKFIDAMYSIGLYPLIDKPSRITQYSATLIDNIFTNELTNQIISGLLINDISDHLPIFSLTRSSPKRLNSLKYKTIRKSSKESVDAFIEDLNRQTWHNTYKSDDANIAYDNFLDTFIKLYNKHCPLKRVINKNLNTNNKPWFTNGLRNACLKNNLLYKEFLKKRTLTVQSRYKSYKNKLTNILRKSEKMYYNQLLHEQRDNIKSTWQTLNALIKKSKQSSTYPESFDDNGKCVSDKNVAVNKFNQYFVNVGVDLANKIPVPKQNKSFHDYMPKTNECNLFLSPVLQEDIITTVNNCKSKTSCDHNNIDMVIIKQVINYIANPLAHVCSTSFEHGVFPDNMKVAKVVPLFKAGDRSVFSNYRPISLLSQFSKILENYSMKGWISSLTNSNF